MSRLSWTQPCCSTCWNEMNPNRQALAMTGGPTEQCSWCGNPTEAGIYVREDPELVPFPAQEDTL